MTRQPDGRISPVRILVFVFLGALVAQGIFTACVQKEKDDIDTSVADDDTASDQQTICGRSFENFVYPFFNKYCLGCHSSVLEGVGRNGAPEGSNFDTLDEIKAQVEPIRASLLDDSGMPPSAPFPGTLERDDIISWLDCGVETDWQAP
jgi:hypothetical protein